MSTAAGPLQLDSVEATLAEDGVGAEIKYFWLAPTVAGPVTYWNKSDVADAGAHDAYGDAQEKYDDALTTLTAAPYNLIFPEPTDDRIRWGFPETVGP